MANTKVTGDLIASGTITAANLVSGTLDTLLNSYLTTNTYATQGYVTTAVNNLIDAAPASLDTLNELAAALNDDANFATTVTNSLATKLNLSGGTLTGDLGIGISPSAKLHLYTSADSDTAIRIQNSPSVLYVGVDNTTGSRFIGSSGSAAYIGTTTSSPIQFATANTIRATIDSSGNVGIGTSSPLATTHIKSGVSGFTGTLNVNYDNLAIEGSGNTGITILTPNNNNAGIAFADEDSSVQGLILYAHSDDFMSFRTAGSESMRITSGGNVGIGTTTPDAKFTILDTATFFKIYQDSTNEMMLTVGTNERMLFGIDGTEKMRISSAGNVGIGESNPLVPLHISRNSASGENIVLILDNNDSTANSEVGLLFRSYVGSTNTDFQIATINTAANQANLVFRSDGIVERMRITNTGNVGIGTTSPGQALTIQTDSSVYNNLELKDSRSKASTPEASIAFRGRYSGAAENTMGLIISKYDNAVDANSSSNMQFYINNGYSVVQSMKLQNDSSLAIANGTQGSNAISSQIIFGNRGYFSNPAVGGAKIVGVSGSPNWYSGTSLAFYTNPGSDVTATAPVERVRILASGGITFNGDTAAANALDDYEEGTWTPSFYFDFAPPSISYVNQEGYYQKIGNTVTVWFDLYATGMNSTSYYWARLGGLPFAPASNNQYIKAPLHHSGNSTFSIGLRGGTNPVMYANLNRTGFARGNDVDSSYISGHFSYIIA